MRCQTFVQRGNAINARSARANRARGVAYIYTTQLAGFRARAVGVAARLAASSQESIPAVTRFVSACIVRSSWRRSVVLLVKMRLRVTGTCTCRWIAGECLSFVVAPPYHPTQSSKKVVRFLPFAPPAPLLPPRLHCHPNFDGNLIGASYNDSAVARGCRLPFWKYEHLTVLLHHFPPSQFFLTRFVHAREVGC